MEKGSLLCDRKCDLANYCFVCDQEGKGSKGVIDLEELDIYGIYTAEDLRNVSCDSIKFVRVDMCKIVDDDCACHSFARE